MGGTGVEFAGLHLAFKDRASVFLIVAALLVLAIGATAISLAPSFWIVMFANGAIAVVGDVFGPAVAAITLGIYRQSRLARRMGTADRGELYRHS